MLLLCYFDDTLDKVEGGGGLPFTSALELDRTLRVMWLTFLVSLGTERGRRAPIYECYVTTRGVGGRGNRGFF